jgi:hypothetical protein
VTLLDAERRIRGELADAVGRDRAHFGSASDCRRRAAADVVLKRMAKGNEEKSQSAHDRDGAAQFAAASDCCDSVREAFHDNLGAMRPIRHGVLFCAGTRVDTRALGVKQSRMTVACVPNCAAFPPGFRQMLTEDYATSLEDVHARDKRGHDDGSP